MDVRIFVKECRSLAAAGFRVSLVVAGASDQIIDGVSIYGVPAARGRLSRIFSTVDAVVSRALALKADAYHLHDPELLRCAGKLLRSGAKVVYDAHEDLPKQLLAKSYIPSLLRKSLSSAVKLLEKRYAAKLSGIVCATPIIANRYKAYQPNTISLCNYPSLEDMPLPVDWSQKSNEVCYIGGIFKTRGAVEMVKAMTDLQVVKLNLAGSYSPEILRSELLQLPGWSQVNELGFLDRNGIRAVLSRSKVGLVVLHPTDSYLEALPVKLFEYMAAGLPVIASDFPILKDIVERHHCGICVNPKDPIAIAAAIDYLLSNPGEAAEMGQRGRRAVEQDYSWNSQSNLLIDFYTKLLS
jgi:glycosyltransferase involved in cell wall biosynthesis